VVARWAHNPKVVGSSPASATSKKPLKWGFFILPLMETFYTYVLYSKHHDKIYIGFTSDLETRFVSHNQLAKKGYTVKYRPWQIIHKEEFFTKTDAMKREKELKSANGRLFVHDLIKKLNTYQG
jgi:putative endonuclease